MASRRAFFRWATAIGGATVALLAGIPALRAFLSPALRRRREENWIRLGDVYQFDSDVPTKVDFAQDLADAWTTTRRLRSVWVYTQDNVAFRVYNGRCTHLGCNYFLDRQSHVFRCPCHTGFFEIKTGTVLGGPPPRPLDTLEVKIVNGILYARYQDFHLGVSEKSVA
jgi:menaquinol-cytochrome c reductase iron-sulfur subunit